jgi:prostaglandin-H2 D-isomerase / glutathione transferase
MSTYKLTYFNLRGRGEVARLIFAAAGVEYEDKRLEFSEWPEVKASK